ncbi:hypothetical protein BK131_03345 [Paenibacillus amylolyticus]|uniref:Uncharacterized protein n=1 Tax=Paenibacillus amylolyticus TaxID=1451 RepID=A0A1R1C4H6_PAEAM|nr:hypothetical protein BK131_03345 [Paenibacillus amylolyticus]
MEFKKIWKWIRFIYALLFIISIVLLVVFLGLLILGMLIDQKTLLNAAIINSLTLIMALISLPGILVQLVSLLEINDKKTFTVTTNCPKCRPLVDLRVKED